MTYFQGQTTWHQNKRKDISECAYSITADGVKKKEII
jgi:hypothetical protein